MKDTYMVTYQITDGGKEYPPMQKEIVMKQKCSVEEALKKDLKKWRSAEGWTSKVQVKVLKYYQSGYSN